MSSGRRTSVALPAQYTDERRSMPTAPRALANVVTHPNGTSRPAPRRSRLNATVMRSTPVRPPEPTSRTPKHGRADQLADTRSPQPLLVLPIFQNRSEGDVDRRLVRFGPTEGGQRRGPVDRFRHAGRLVKVHRAHALDRAGHLRRQ